MDQPVDGPAPAPSPADVTIVGIGASAGGLAAFDAFFAAIPADTEPGMAFVLVQHLAPDHKSLLPELVRRYTSMPVYDVEEGMRVLPNCVYIIPPNRDMAVLNGTLHLMEPAAPRGLRLPIDFFFRSLAQDRHDRAICIVLSGTGSDGTLGARAVKGEGGMVMAQTPASTEYDGMPRSVIATGLVDYVLAPAEMPAQLLGFAARRFGGGHEPDIVASYAGTALQQILVLLRARTGHDFSQYKQRTVIRRIERRMAVHQIEGFGAYVRYMQEQPSEADALFGDLLIGVTSFFRDAEAFAAFDEQVVAHLFDHRPADAPVRIWVAGCSTGEEAYSIVILLQERMQALKQSFKVQCFATDVDSRAIETARAGIYPANIAADVSAERLGRFFVQHAADGSYRVHKTLRDMLVFSEQDVIKDPPFSRLDVISCRNLMIYMGAELHQKLIPLFHYALNPNGVLLLGTSETVGEFGDLFVKMDRHSKMYRRREVGVSARRPAVESLLPPLLKGRMAQNTHKARAGTADRFRTLTEQALLKQDHVGALVNQRGELLYLHGRTGQYFELAPGEAAMNVLRMAREGLRHTLITALHDAAAQKTTIRHTGLAVRTNGGFSRVNLTVRPAESGPGPVDPSLFVVILEDASTASAGLDGPPDGATADTVAEGADADARIAALTRELRAKEEFLRTSNEELATSNEELKSANEEMQSVNEELQSANEELETSKEELQSINEELATVNAELQTKMIDLSRVNNDLNNLLAGTGMGTVFVDHQLRIQRFTPAITQVVNLIQTDFGRPIGDVTSNLLGYESLIPDIQGVLDTLTPKEVEVQTRSGAWFLLRIRPYRTLENVIEGAVVTFTEITDLRKARIAVQESETLRRLAVVVRDSSDAVLVVAMDGRILAWNPAAVRSYGWSEAEALTMNVRSLVPEGERESALPKFQALVGSAVPAPYQTQRLTRDGHFLQVWLTATQLVDDGGRSYAIATTERIVRATHA